jgi:hypothetical protein
MAAAKMKKMKMAKGANETEKRKRRKWRRKMKEISMAHRKIISISENVNVIKRK